MYQSHLSSSLIHSRIIPVLRIEIVTSHSSSSDLLALQQTRLHRDTQHQAANAVNHCQNSKLKVLGG